MIRSDLPTVIVPAYNEASSIATLLAQIVDGVYGEEYQVIVACNGCLDNTVEIVRRQFPEISCLDIGTPSKTNAINTAEALRPGFPRIYIDADVQISCRSVTRLIHTLQSENSPLVVAPRAVPLTEASDRLVQWFYAAWQKTVYFIEDGFGSGVYGLNRAARETFSVFPDLISDDGFVRALGPDVRLQVCEESRSRVQVPRSIKDLLAIKVRSKLGKLELMRKNPELDKVKSSQGGVLREKARAKFARTPSIPELLTYLGINAIAQLGAIFQLRRMDNYRWQRDESTRGRA